MPIIVAGYIAYRYASSPPPRLRAAAALIDRMSCLARRHRAPWLILVLLCVVGAALAACNGSATGSDGASATRSTPSASTLGAPPQSAGQSATGQSGDTLVPGDLAAIAASTAAASASSGARSTLGSSSAGSRTDHAGVAEHAIPPSESNIAAVTPGGQISVPPGEKITPLFSATPPPPTPTPTPLPTSTPAPAGTRPVIGGCTVFPADNSWNQDISQMPVDANSANYIASIGSAGHLHADFGGGGAYGIPFIVVPQSQPMTPINFVDYGDESDPGPYPIPLTAPMEGGGVGDSHVLALQQGTCTLYEMFNAHPASGHWDASSGAIFDLNSNALRPDSWTSADAAGLPILPGLVRYDEVQAGAINHAIRFTVNTVQRAWVHPATHYGTSTNVNTPPYGAKLRLKASFDLSPYHGQARVVLDALKRYGMIVADQGTSWYITGAADSRWDDNDLNQLKLIPGNAFDVVEVGPITHY